MFIIPVRKKKAQTTSALKRQSLLSDVPEALREHAQTILSDLETDAINSGLKYITILTSTYLFLMEQIKRSMDGTLVAHLTSDQSEDTYRCPTLEEWKANNPAKSAALHIVELDLRSKGWEPVVILSGSKYCVNRDCYEGDYFVILSCSLADD